MSNYLVAFDDVQENFVKTNIDESTVPDRTKRTGIVDLAQGVATKSVTFDTPFSSLNYILNLSLENKVDTDPAFQPLLITNKTVNGFTADWNEPTDTANYKLSYNASLIETLQVTGSFPVSQGLTSVNVAFNASLPTNDYALNVDILNTTDADPMYFKPIITAKTTSSFALKWNQPTDTANYLIDYKIEII